LEGIEVVNKLKSKKIDLFLSGGDFVEVNQYLIEHFRSNGGVSVVVGDGLFYENFYKDYYKAKGTPIEEDSANKSLALTWKQKIRNRSAINIVKGGIRVVFRPVLKIKINLKKRVNDFLNYRLIPFLMLGKIYTINTFTKYNFTVGVADYVIVTDLIEYEGIKLLIPVIKKIFLAKHPSYDMCQYGTTKNRNKLLVLFGGGFPSQFSDKEINRWVLLIEEIKKIKNPIEIHLRFHPREKLSVKKRFEDAFKAKNIQIIMINSNKCPLLENFDEYMGIVGSRSGGLKIARIASQKIFVIGLVDGVESDFYGKPINMGDSEGIHWLSEGDVLTKEKFDVPHLSKNENPTIAEILNNILEPEV
jgi:hypothetical protein